MNVKKLLQIRNCFLAGLVLILIALGNEVKAGGAVYPGSYQSGDWSNPTTWQSGAKTGTGTTIIGNPAVTGVGTLYLTEFAIGDAFYCNKIYQGIISAIGSNTGLTLVAGAVSSQAAKAVSNGRAPASSDALTINSGHTVTVDISNAACASLAVNANVSNVSSTLTFASGGSPQLTVTGVLTLGNSNNVAKTGILTFTSGSTLIAGSITLGTIANQASSIDMTAGGYLKVNGTITIGFTGALWTPGAGTVELTATNNLPATILTSFNNLTINGASTTTTLGVNTAVNGTLTQTAGTIAVGVRTLTVNGTHIAGTNIVSGAGGYTLASGATLQTQNTSGVNGTITTTTKTLNTGANYTFNGISGQVTGALMPVTVNNLTISNSAGVTLSQSTAVNGSLTVNSGATLLTSAAQVVSGSGTLTGNGTVNVTRATGTADFTGQYTITNKTLTNLTVAFVGAGAQGIAANTFGSVTINNGSGVSLGGAVIVGGTLTLTNGALGVGSNTLTLNGTVTATSGSLTSSPTGTVIYGSSSTQNILAANYGNLTCSGAGSRTLASSGTIGIAGTFTPGTNSYIISGSTVDFNGTSQAIPAFTYATLNTSNSGTKTAGGTIITSTLDNGGASNNAVILDMAGNTLTATTIDNTSAIIKFSGASNGNAISTGTIEYSGSGQTVTSGTYNNLTINQTSGTATLIANSTVSGNLSISNGSLTINPSVDLTVNGTTTLGSADCLKINSDATGTGSFIDNGTFGGSGTADVQKFIVANTYGKTTCAPINNAGTSVFGSNPIKYYDPLTYSWLDFTSGSMGKMKGYFTKFTSDGTLNFNNGTLYTGTQTYTDLWRTGTTTSSNHGWNFIGNPYPSAINWDNVVTLNGGSGNFVTTTKLNNAIYVSDGNGGYNSYINGVGTPNNLVRIVPAATAFWVQINIANINASAPIAGATLSFNNTCRVHQNTVSSKIASTQNIIRLSLNNTNFTDAMVVRLEDAATNQYDPEFDAFKMPADNASYPQIYSITSSSDYLSINSIPDNLTQPVAVQLGFTDASSNSLTINAFDFSDIDPNVSINLEDVLLSHMTDLRVQPSYTFTTAVSEDNSRFILHFGATTTNISNPNNENNTVYAYGNAIYISQIEEPTVCVIYNMLGQEVERTQLTTGSLNKIDVNLQTGTYIVTLMSAKHTTTQKVLIQK